MEVLIMSGLPGSGKSYYANQIQQRDPQSTRIISADNWLLDPLKPTQEDLKAAHKSCCRAFVWEITNEHLDKVIVDNTNLQAWEIAPYYLMAEAFNHKVSICRILCDPEVAFKCQTHNVPFDKYCQMVVNFKRRDVMPWWTVYEVDNSITMPGN